MLNQKLTGASSAATYIEDVFSTYLFNTAYPSNVSVINGIDFATKGGMLWTKSRSGASDSQVFDTIRGGTKYIRTASTGAETTDTSFPITFNSDGFGWTQSGGWGSGSFVGWSFRKQPKFFDVVTYTGNGVDGRSIAHNLGSDPGFIIVKRTDSTGDWKTWHRSGPTQMCLNLTAIPGATVYANGYVSTPTSTTFDVNAYSSSITDVNASGATYVAYLFAHNAGGFGLTGTDNVISCGSFTDSSGAVSLGYEPQFLLYKSSTNADSWTIVDTMRGLPATGTTTQQLYPNQSASETGGYSPYITSTGFYVQGVTAGTYIYIAIRRGPMKVPTDGTKVFYPVAATVNSNNFSETTNFPVDLLISESRTGSISRNFNDRLRGGSATGMVYLNSTTTGAEGTVASHGYGFDYNTKIVDNFNYWNAGTDNFVYWNFQRAPSFFDEVCYTGTGSATTFSHNLGAVPQLMIVKARSVAGSNWAVYAAPLGATDCVFLNLTNATSSISSIWNNTAPTSSVFTVGTAGGVNTSGTTYVAYLFATCAGVSKVGSYTGNGSSQTINCGFTAGARFILIKRTDSTGDWYVWDTARGIVSGNDPHLSLNTTSAEVTTDDSIDPDSSGFIVNQVSGIDVNVSSATYIYLAIA